MFQYHFTNIESLWCAPRGKRMGSLLKALLFLSLCTGAVAANANGSSAPVVSFSPSSLSFAGQPVGTKSNPQTVTLKNLGPGTLGISSIAATGAFVESNNCKTTLSAGSGCTVSVTFDPTTVGSASGAIAVKDNGSQSPQSVSLSGTGINQSGTGTCLGTPMTQLQTNVTSQLSYANTAAGVQVSQLTDSGTNRFDYFDVPAFSSAIKQILYLDFVAGHEAVIAQTGGTNAQVVTPTIIGSDVFLTGDGILAYYDRAVLTGPRGGLDMYGTFLNASGTCEEIRLTNLDVPPLSPLSSWEFSTASPDGAGGYVIGFSPDTLLHRVHVLASQTSQALPTMTLNDPESAATFHRIRFNPKFSNIVMYKRNQVTSTTAGPEIWVVDLNTCSNGVCAASEIVNILQGVKERVIPAGGHPTWSPDGMDIAYLDTNSGTYWMAWNVVTASGTLNSKFSVQQLGPLGRGANLMTADYCVFPPNWPSATVLACMAGAGSPLNPKTLYLMSSDGKGTTKLLAATDAPALTYDGTPMPVFSQDDQHILFNSDRTGLPQVYVVSGFTLTVP